MSLWVAGFAALLACSAAHASLVGSSVLITEYYPDLSSQFGSPAGPMTIPAGGWSTGAGFSNIDITVAGTTITLAGTGTYNSATFNGFDIQVLTPSTKISSATLDPSSLPLPAGFLTFDQHDVWVNVEDVTFTKNVVIDVATSNVPEPASWAMMLIGIGLIGAMARQRRIGAAPG